MVQQINERVYGQDIPVDTKHNSNASGVMAWIKEARVNSDGSADARVEWSKRGEMVVEQRQFKYTSPFVYPHWTDAATQKTYTDVVTSLALTERPHFKENVMRPMLHGESSKETPMSNPKDVTPQAFAEMQQKFEERIQGLEDDLEKERTARQSAEAKAESYGEQVTDLSGRLQTMEAEARNRRFDDLIANDGAMWFGEAPKHKSVLTALGEGSDGFKAYVEQQNALAEQMADSQLFKEIGSNRRDGKPSAGEQMDKMEQTYAEENKVSIEAASAHLARNSAEYQQLYREVHS